MTDIVHLSDAGSKFLVKKIEGSDPDHVNLR